MRRPSVSREARTLCRILRDRSGGRTSSWEPLADVSGEAKWSDELAAQIVRFATERGWIRTEGDPSQGVRLTAEGLRIANRRKGTAALFR